MSSSSLNPNAPEFYPSCSSSDGCEGYYVYSWDPEVEEAVTSEELCELEACEQWCEQMAELAESEREHLISLALTQAPPEQILEVELKAHALDLEPGHKAGQHKGKRGNKPAAH